MYDILYGSSFARIPALARSRLAFRVPGTKFLLVRHDHSCFSFSFMSGTLLPHGLLDLTLARAAARLDGAAYHSIRRSVVCSARRHAHQSVSLENLTVSEGDHSLYAR